MITVKLLYASNVHPEDSASHAAKTCHQDSLPALGERIDVRRSTFATGHHTTIQHFYLTFAIDGIAVGDVTFGLHLVSPFYNSDQRSGRFCAKMFLEPDFDRIMNYIYAFWPQLGAGQPQEILSYLRKGINLFQANISAAEKLARQLIAQERPRASAGYLEKNAPNIAQEQTRMFIPIVFPTGLDFTINLSALAALHAAAWTPQLKHITGLMVKEVRAKWPEISYMFNREYRLMWWPETQKHWFSPVRIKYQPRVQLDHLDVNDCFQLPAPEIMHPIDQLHFRPEQMENSVYGIKTCVQLSVATMGQDQRHRTIARGLPKFTGDFYLPPILRLLGLENSAKDLMTDWLRLAGKGLLPRTLVTILAPYGAIVAYKKSGSFNALAHEQAKRLCWCAQEEIYHLSRLLRAQVRNRAGKNSELLGLFEPACLKNGVCIEGSRYCGRDLQKRDPKTYFPLRKI